MVYADFMNGDDSKTGVIFIFLVSIREKNTPSLSFRTRTQLLRIFSLTATYTVAPRQSK